jgi:hypothetical protein
LYALLESANKHVTGVGEVHVIYRASDAAYDAGYKEVKKDFPAISYHQQGAQPRQDFKPLTLRATFGSPHAYVVFAVDDIIVKDDINLCECAALLEETGAYGFYLRLGTNLDYCYSLNCAQHVPPLTKILDDVWAWRIATGQADWGYPNSVDMTVVRKREIKPIFERMQYHHPNTLEAAWAGTAGLVMQRNGLCYTESKIVNLPLNRVQDEYKNRCMDVSAAELLDVFNNGLKIDIDKLFRIKNKSAHMEYALTFVVR